MGGTQGLWVGPCASLGLAHTKRSGQAGRQSQGCPPTVETRFEAGPLGEEAGRGGVRRVDKNRGELLALGHSGLPALRARGQDSRSQHPSPRVRVPALCMAPHPCSPDCPCMSPSPQPFPGSDTALLPSSWPCTSQQQAVWRPAGQPGAKPDSSHPSLDPPRPGQKRLSVAGRQGGTCWFINKHKVKAAHVLRGADGQGEGVHVCAVWQL